MQFVALCIDDSTVQVTMPFDNDTLIGGVKERMNKLLESCNNSFIKLMKR